MSEPKRPQKSDFDAVVRLKRTNNWLLYIIFVLSVTLPFLKSQEKYQEIVLMGEIFNITLMVIFAAITFIVDYYLFPKAERVRRSDFIDNSFGTISNVEQSEKYFSNDAIERGIYKASANLFENCLFTCKISKKMRFRQIMKSSIFALVIIGFAVIGFRNNQLAVPILQLFLSANILGDLIKLLLFVGKNERIFEDLLKLFGDRNFKSSPYLYLPHFLKIYSDYETNLAWAMILLDSKIYKEVNPSLSVEWEALKQKLSI